MSKNTSVEKILDAAAAVVAEEGIAKLTISGVAAKAGLSKGGVLHHFRTKDQLVASMVQRLADRWRDSSNKAYDSVPEGPGRMTRGILLWISNAKVWSKELQHVSATVFAGLAHDPKLIEPLRDTYKELYQRLENDGLPKGVSITVLAAIDGIWLWWVLGLRKLDQNLIDEISGVLKQLINIPSE